MILTYRFGKGSLTEGLGKKQLSETNNLVSCQTDAIFAVRQLMEKHREKQKGLHMVYIDLEKAYDRVPRQEVWRCTREKGVPEKYVMIVKDMYEGARTRVKSSVGITDMIPVGVGLHQ